jgi:hypothetical protein
MESRCRSVCAAALTTEVALACDSGWLRSYGQTRSYSNKFDRTITSFLLTTRSLPVCLRAAEFSSG